MTAELARRCAEHADRFACPDALLDYTAKFDEYGIIVHDGGHSVRSLAFCPWCGHTLPKSKRDLWFQELARLGIVDPLVEPVPAEFESDAWWRASHSPAANPPHGIDGDDERTDICDWIFEENLAPWLDMTARLSGYALHPDESEAFFHGLKDSDCERGRWFEYEFNNVRLKLARDPGTSVLSFELALPAALVPRYEAITQVAQTYHLRARTVDAAR